MILSLKRIQIYVHIHIWKIIFSCMCDSNIRIEWLLREHIYIRSAMDMDMDMDMDMSKYIWTRYMPVCCTGVIIF